MRLGQYSTPALRHYGTLTDITADTGLLLDAARGSVRLLAVAASNPIFPGGGGGGGGGEVAGAGPTSGTPGPDAGGVLGTPDTGGGAGTAPSTAAPDGGDVLRETGSGSVPSDSDPGGTAGESEGGSGGGSGGGGSGGGSGGGAGGNLPFTGFAVTAVAAIGAAATGAGVTLRRVLRRGRS